MKWVNPNGYQKLKWGKYFSQEKDSNIFTMDAIDYPIIPGEVQKELAPPELQIKKIGRREYFQFHYVFQDWC